MVLRKHSVPGRPTIWMMVGQGPTVLAVGAGGVCLDIFTLIYTFFPLSPSLWETARYRLKYCLKGPLNPKSTNQPIRGNLSWWWWLGGCLGGYTSVFNFSMKMGSVSGPHGILVHSVFISFSIKMWDGRVVRWYWVNFQCRGVLQY